MYDIIIIGGGPAGLTAALYSLRAGKSVLVIEKGTFGGQITFSPKVENIPGFVEISGVEFAEKMVDQVLSQGAEVECAEVLEVKDGKTKTVVTDCGTFEGKAIIIATGAKHRLLGLDREEEFIGNGISFCAVCDGAFYIDKTVALIGGGNSALVEGILLANQVKKLYIVQNLSTLTAEKKLCDQIVDKENVEIITDSIVDSLIADEELTGIVINNTTTNEKRTLNIDGMFVAIGLVPQNEIFKDLVELNNWGYIESGENCRCNREGFFVAGDCRSKRIRQVTTAASDGAIAALAACDYVDNLDK